MRNVRPESGRSGAPNHDGADPVVGGPQGSRKLRPIRYLFSFCVLSLGPSLCPYVCPSGCPCVHPHPMPFGDPQSRQYGPLVLGARNSRVTLGQKMAVWGRNHESATQSLGSRNFQGSFARTVCPPAVFAKKRLFALIDASIIMPFFVVRVNLGRGAFPGNFLKKRFFPTFPPKFLTRRELRKFAPLAKTVRKVRGENPPN